MGAVGHIRSANFVWRRRQPDEPGLDDWQGQFGQALDPYPKALSHCEQLGNPKDIAETRKRIFDVEAKLSGHET